MYSLEYALEHMGNYDNLKKIYVITQINSSDITELANLIRLRNTLSLVPKLEWILIEEEEAFNKSRKILNFIAKSEIPKTSYLLSRLYLNNSVDSYVTALNWLISNQEASSENCVIIFTRSSTSYAVSFFEQVCLIF